MIIDSNESVQYNKNVSNDAHLNIAIILPKSGISSAITETISNELQFNVFD